jgi:hypothetical protein
VRATARHARLPAALSRSTMASLSLAMEYLNSQLH